MEVLERVAQKMGCGVEDVPGAVEKYNGFDIWPQKVSAGYDWVCDVRGVSNQEKYDPDQDILLEEVSLEEAGSLLGMADISNASINYRGQKVNGKVKSKVRGARNRTRDFLVSMGYL